MIRVVVAENSPAARAALLRLAKQDSQIQIVGVTETGREAFELAKSHRPNLIVLGLDLCLRDEFDTGREIMIEVPTPIVLLRQPGQSMPASASQLNLCGCAVATLELPPADAPANSAVEKAFLAKLKAMAGVKVVRQWRRGPPQAAQRNSNMEMPPVRLVAIAASTGGPAALRHVLGGLSADFQAPILIVQHVAQGFARNVASWLDSVCSLTVKLAEDGERLSPATVYLAPDGWHLGLGSRTRIKLAAEDPIGGFRPSANYLFRSVAQHYGPLALSLLLTGMGRDGVEGLRDVKAAGGKVIAQDEETSIVFGMPGEAVREGLVDLVLPLGKISGTLMEMTRPEITGGWGDQNTDR